ncbi:class I SAM-dependent methyltransferase [Pleurocapsa sp. PCC 7319]|uniref:class I SAM-dependent methyltransferase n=1 Tax=Pleurocapsa sp. PCC 7319 TaxID=118161 RepID=UPI000347B8FC|nr:class I SAM-dependent methyltransferase [Pleurocapsa sp. PCC 7319]
MTDDLAAIKEQDSLEKYLEIAKQLQQQSQNSQALEKYLQVLTIRPNHIPALNQVAELYETDQQFDQAVSYYQQIIKLQPDNSIRYVRLAKAMMSQNNIQGAITAYQQAITLKHDSPAWVYHDLGDALIKDAKVKEAIVAYRQALNKRPLNPTTIKRKLNHALNLEPDNPLRQIATSIQREAPYTGGPVQHFEMVGRDTIITLLQNGLRPDHTILDFGCGALRLGYWIIRLMERDKYYGIEPNFPMLEAGKKYSLDTELINLKQPQFSTNSQCDFSVFGVKFDFVVARSIFTHTTPALLRKTLQSFRANSTENGIMLASYWPLEYSKPGEIGDQLPLTDSRFIRVVKYSLATIQSWSTEFGLKVSEYRVNPLINEQVWLKFERSPSITNEHI